MKQPAVSVYMPVYNREKYVKEAIDSILSQSFTDFELIIVDDGSTDNSVAVIQEIQDERIVFLQNEQNSGVRKTANKALKVAKGKYIVRMDSDDISLPGRLQKQYDFMEAHPLVGIAGGNLQLFGNETDVWRFPFDNDSIKAGLCFEPTISQPASIIRSDLLQKGFVFSEQGLSFAEDYELWYKMKDACFFGNLDEILIRYRREDQNITVELKDKSRQLLSLIYKRILADLDIDAGEKELELHHILQSRFSADFSAFHIKEVAEWIEKLIAQNDKKNIFPADAFRELLNDKWKRLFYFLPPYGFSVVHAYARLGTLPFSQLFYYVKYLVNRFLGRK